jgi:glycosyltransferase
MSPPTLADYGAWTARRDRDQPASGAPPIVSVVTASFNAAATIERTVRSVQAQSFPAIEQIFVDGASSDGTVELLRRLARPQDYAISEPDRGISDAFNRGIALARGRYIQVLNADDWLSHDQVAIAVAALERHGADFVFGDLIFYDRDQPAFLYRGDADYARVIDRRMPAIGHPTVLVRREWFERVGLFDLAYGNAMDYDWLLRLHRAGARGVYVPEIVGHMTHDGVSNQQFRRTIEEVKRIAIVHGRNAWLASAEAAMRRAKTSLSQPMKRYARPLYHLVRRAINPAYCSLAMRR